MLRTVILHGKLAQFGESFQLDVKSPIEAVRALMIQIKGFRQVLREGYYKVLKGDEALSLEELSLRLGRSTEIHIVPTVEGSASGWGKILTGVAIIGLAIAAPYALGIAGGFFGGAIGAGFAGTAFAGISFTSIAGFGALIALGGVAQMLSPTPTSTTPVEAKTSFLFGSATNVSKQGSAVPVVFGEFIVGSVVISVGLETEDIGTDVNVALGIQLRDSLNLLGSAGAAQSLLVGH